MTSFPQYSLAFMFQIITSPWWCHSKDQSLIYFLLLVSFFLLPDIWYFATDVIQPSDLYLVSWSLVSKDQDFWYWFISNSSLVTTSSLVGFFFLTTLAFWEFVILLVISSLASEIALVSLYDALLGSCHLHLRSF